MIKNIVIAAALVMGSFAASTLSVHAQSTQTGALSEDQMIDLFKKQKTRGLMIAPSSQPQSTDGASTSASAAGTPPPPKSETKVAYDAMPKDEQVNINISFDFDSSALREDQKPKLVALCGAMKKSDVHMFRILGHTDSSGTAAYNERLSKLRAEEVKRYLVSDCGIPADKMEAVGVGERYPLDAANPRADVNRRVEFQALS